MKIIGVIPARYSSSRFPAKPLADILGKPMIWWVYKQVKKVEELDEVVVATDDERIANVCSSLNIKYIMTSKDNNTSTERLYEVAQHINADYYICINGDEPLIDPNIIQCIIPKDGKRINEVYVANLMTRIKDPVQVVDNTNIKVVVNNDSELVYISRSPIPYPKSSMNFYYRKHLGVLAYNFEALKLFKNSDKRTLEKIEDINELRFIEYGQKINMIEVDAETLSVDTPKDLDNVISILKAKLDKGENIYE